MAIPSAQLETWSHQGGTGISSDAYDRVRLALTKQGSPLNGRQVEIYLQGSYANQTNTHGDSDIDVVVHYPNTFYEDLSALTAAERQVHAAHFNPATYHWSHLRDEVLAALRSHFGHAAVTPDTKAIKVTTGVGRMTADVLPAVQYRRYATYPNPANATAHWGIQFFDSNGVAIVNYPKYHIERGQDKNQASRTGGRYKPTVRLFKNLRSYMVDNGYLAAGIASSYYVESLLHNVPDALFGNDFSASVPAILNYLLTTPYSGFTSQNGITPLTGTGPTEWPAEHAAAFVTAAKRTWDNW